MAPDGVAEPKIDSSSLFSRLLGAGAAFDPLSGDAPAPTLVGTARGAGAETGANGVGCDEGDVVGGFVANGAKGLTAPVGGFAAGDLPGRGGASGGMSGVGLGDGSGPVMLALVCELAIGVPAALLLDFGCGASNPLISTRQFAMRP